MKYRTTAFLLNLIVPIALIAQESRQSRDTLGAFEVIIPTVVLKGIDFPLSVRALNADGNLLTTYSGSVSMTGATVRTPGGVLADAISLTEGVFATKSAIVSEKADSIVVQHGSVIGRASVRAIPGIVSILPPLLAIVLALVIRQVVIALVAGIWLGAVFIFGDNVIAATFRVADHFVVNALSSPNHVSIIVFSMLFGGMVGIITRNGGTLGIANLVTRFAKTPRGVQISTGLLDILMFFDDYANCLVVGNLMRPITDRLKISREKLAYIVDSGAATVSSVFLISTWIGFELGLIDQGLKAIGSSADAYSVFLNTIPYRFYPILALAFVFIVALTGRDFGPMLAAERRSRYEGKLIRDGAQPAADATLLSEVVGADVKARWYNGIIPIFTILVVAGLRLYVTGTESLRGSGSTEYTISMIISNSDSYSALLWASLSACLVAVFMSVGERVLTLVQSMDAWFSGIRSMLFAMLILVLAWSIGAVTDESHTADYLGQILRGAIAPQWLPVLTFVIAALTSFATGTSWGTMAIMMPLVIPLGHNLSIDAGLQAAEYEIILHGVISSVLAGAVFGDHCSPISDTTILSSMSSACDHIDHVRTQLPYAVLVAIIGMLVGDIATAFGLSPWISIVAGILLLTGVMLTVGRKV
ncbi:MAG: Na+/H+ antiporter NhaC family protein [Bacteroidota bacterium]